MLKKTSCCVLILAGSLFTSASDNVGSDIYALLCFSCHGKDGTGKTAAGARLNLKDLSSPDVQAQSDDDLFESIAVGAKHKEYPHNYAARGLTRSEIRSTVAFIRTLRRPAKKK